MALGTIVPNGYQTELDATGAPISGALIYTYSAGTLTPITTYSDYQLTTPNTNPIVADSAGRWVAFLVPGQSYKFLHCLPIVPIPDPTSPPSAYETVDHILGTPIGAVTFSGVLGETVTAGQGVYLSNGSGGKTAGRWYLWSNANAYSSFTPELAIATQAGNAADTIQLQQNGLNTQVSGLVAGTSYYVGTSGAFISTANRRYVGQAVSSSAIIFDSAAFQAIIDNSTVDGRLTLTTGVPVTTTDVTAATTVYFAPYKGNTISIYDGVSGWVEYSFSQVSIAVPATTGSIYDVFAYVNAGSVALELSAAWTSDTAIFSSGTYQTTRPTQDGVYVKSTNGTAIDATRRYLGSFRTTAVSGQTEDSVLKRYLWNYYNRVERTLQRYESTATWAYTTATWRQMNNSTANQVEIVVGSQEETVTVGLSGGIISVGTDPGYIGIGYDSTSSPLNGSPTGGTVALSNVPVYFLSYTAHMPAVGRHFYAALEKGGGSGSTNFIGTSGNVVNGLTGRWRG